MVKQQMYLPLHGGPPVAIRGTPPRKAKQTMKPRRSTATAPVTRRSSAPAAATSTAAASTSARSTRSSPALAAPAKASPRSMKATTPAQPASASARRSKSMTDSKPPPASVAAVKPVAAVSAPIPAVAAEPLAPLTPVSAPVILSATAPAAAQPIAAPVAPPSAAPEPAIEPALPPQPAKRKRWHRDDAQGPSLMEPYESVTCATLRNECKRRGISIWSEANREMRHKKGYIQMLREDDQRRAAQDASARIHQQDLEELQLGGSFEAPTSASGVSGSASPSAATPTAGYSFLSPSALTATPASAAAATAAVLYPPTLPAIPPPAAAVVATLSSSSVKAPAKGKAAVESHKKPSTARSVRARRGCYVRLINVMLTPEFNARWREMNDAIDAADTTADVNQFWLDVHVAFMSVNQLYDALHFYDVLFRTVDPSVIQAHEASRLRQMWHEVVDKYQRAVADSKKPVQTEDEAAQSFFSSCDKRTDVLYLHMGLLLEPELSEFVLNMAPVPSGSATSQRRPQTAGRETAVAAAASRKSATGAQKTAAKRRTSVSPKGSASKRPAKVDVSTPPRQRASSFSSLSSPARTATPFSPVRLAGGAGECTIEEDPGGQSYALVVSGELRDSAFETFAPHAFRDDDSGSSDYDAELPTRAMTPRKRRRRRELSSDIVEFHPSTLRGNELVVHQGDRMQQHHSSALTTTMTTAASAAVQCQADEWVILENRLRKVSESLDRCHRALSGSDGQVSESHRMSLESDLRFYAAIKQRLQEQLLMVMQGF